MEEKEKNKVKFEERLQYGKYIVSPPSLPRRDSITSITASPRINKENDKAKNIVILPDIKKNIKEEDESSEDDSLKQIVLHPNDLYDQNNLNNSIKM